MKNLFVLIALVGSFTFLASSAASAQTNFAINYTSCDMLVVVAYGPSSCNVTGYLSTVVPANGQASLSIPVGTNIIKAKGKYNGTSGCVFYVGESCTPYPTVDGVGCGVGCGDYTASFSPITNVLKFYN